MSDLWEVLFLFFELNCLFLTAFFMYRALSCHKILFSASGFHLFDNASFHGSIHSFVYGSETMTDSCSDLHCRHKKIIELLPDAIICIDAAGMICYVNQQALKLLKAKTAADLLNLPVSDIIIKYCDEESDNKQPIRYICMKCKNNQLLVAESEYIEHAEGTIVIIRKSSLSKRNERILKLYNREKERINQFENDNIKRSNYQSVLSHELKTPINIIFSSLQILEIHKNEMAHSNGRYWGMKLCKNIDLIKQNCYRLIRLINNIIDIDKLESGFMKLHYKKIDIVSLVRNICESASEYAVIKDIRLIFESDMNTFDFLCDPEKIERILLNLISNAIKFTDPKGLILIGLKHDKKNIFISVKDTGIGIPAEKINLIFNRFEQADNALVRNQRGSGIGLNLVKEIVKLCGGSVEVTSVVGKGSEFVVSLPIVKENYSEVCEEKTAYDSKIEEISIELSNIYENIKAH